MPDFLKRFDNLKTSVKDRISSFEAQHRPAPSQAQHPHPSTPYWHPTFDPSIPISTFFRHETGAHGWGNAELQDYTTSLSNSLIRTLPSNSHGLVLRALASAPSFTSARLTSLAPLGRDAGYLSARISAPSAPGIWPAFWLLPTEPFTWPRDGEIDVMESWDGSGINHACLHWGQHDGADADKHRVVETAVAGVDDAAGHEYGFAWRQEREPGRRGRLVWYVDGRAVMRAEVPKEMGRRVSEFQVKLNIAMGGNVMGGRRPEDGVYEMVVHEMGFYEAPPGGWERFDGEMRV